MNLLNMMPSLFSAFLLFILFTKANGILQDKKDNHIAVCSAQSHQDFNIFEQQSECTADYCHIELNLTTPLVPPLLARGYSNNSKSECYITEEANIAMDIHFSACSGLDQMINLRMKKRFVSLADVQEIMKDYEEYVYNTGSACVAIEVHSDAPFKATNVVPFFECFIVSGFGYA